MKTCTCEYSPWHVQTNPDCPTHGKGQSNLSAYGTDSLFPELGKEGQMRRHACIRGEYRLWLSRMWGEGPELAVVMLNPSVANAEIDDPTIRRLYHFGRREGYGGFYVVNLFALRSPDPRVLKKHADPVGKPLSENFTPFRDNDHAIQVVLGMCQAVLCAWGTPEFPERVAEVQTLIRHSGKPCFCLGLTQKGQPKHPLYISKEKPFEPYILGGSL